MPVKIVRARFDIGTIVRHRKFGYRGLIYDVDPTFDGSEDWYDMMADSKPCKASPWYHVLVDGESHTTYVAEANLDFCNEEAGFDHPMLPQLFEKGGAAANSPFEALYLVN